MAQRKRPARPSLARYNPQAARSIGHAPTAPTPPKTAGASAAQQDSPVFSQLGHLAGRQNYTNDLLNDLESKLKTILLPPMGENANTAAPTPSTILGQYLDERIEVATGINHRITTLIERLVL